MPVEPGVDLGGAGPAGALRTRSGRAQGQAQGIAPHRGHPAAYRCTALGEVDVDLVGQRGHPGEHVGELVLALGLVALAHRLRQLAHLLGEPGDRARHPALPVALAVGALDDVLQVREVHARQPTPGRQFSEAPPGSGGVGSAPNRPTIAASRRSSASTVRSRVAASAPSSTRCRSVGSSTIRSATR